MFYYNVKIVLSVNTATYIYIYIYKLFLIDIFITPLWYRDKQTN